MAWLIRKMQLTSNSPELLLCRNDGALSIVKGNPFSGGITGIKKMLPQKVSGRSDSGTHSCSKPYITLLVNKTKSISITDTG